MRGRLKLKKLVNARDLGGLPCGDKQIVCGKLIRSGDLSKIPAKTARALKELGVKTVVDLRIENERRAHPDVEIAGSRYLHLPILCVPTIGITWEYDPAADEGERKRIEKEGERIKREFGSIDGYMKAAYRSIVFTPEGQEGLKKFLGVLLGSEGCVLWHCMSGKDRAGICAMLVEALLGADEETILGDYMLSGRFLRFRYFINRTALVLVPTSMRLKRILFGLMRTKREYLCCILREMEEKYGGVIGYCKQCLGVTDADIAALREKYLEDTLRT